MGRYDKNPSQEALSAAIGMDELSVVFQPIVDLRNGRSFAYEALVRCNAPGLEAPPALFRHAVEHDYCGRLGRRIRELTVRRCPGVPLFCNVHPAELVSRWLIRPDDPIFSHDSDVYIEITESVPFSHYEHCVSVLRELRSRGSVYLVIDDLGAGYSNLSRICDLDPKVVKIDMALVRELDKHQRRQSLVRSIVAMCEEQGADVVAEGIETRDELNAVRDTGCHYGQGYVLARPSFPLPRVRWPTA